MPRGGKPIMNEHQKKLFHAASECDPVGVAAALAGGADPNLMEPGGREHTRGAALHLAASASSEQGRADTGAGAGGGVAEVVRVLVGGGAHVDLNRPHDGRTPLSLAVAEGSPQAVAALLAAGASPRIRDSEGWTPLHHAAYYGAADAAAALLAAVQRTSGPAPAPAPPASEGAAASDAGQGGGSSSPGCPHGAAAPPPPQPQPQSPGSRFVDEETGAGATPLSLALSMCGEQWVGAGSAGRSYAATITLLAQHGADVRGWHDPITGEPALHAAVRQGAGAATVAALVAAGADPNQAHGEEGATALHAVAAWPGLRGRLGEARALLGAGADPNAAACDGTTPLMLAVQALGVVRPRPIWADDREEGEEEEGPGGGGEGGALPGGKVALLLAHGADPLARDSDGVPLLLHAVAAMPALLAPPPPNSLARLLASSSLREQGGAGASSQQGQGQGVGGAGGQGQAGQGGRGVGGGGEGEVSAAAREGLAALRALVTAATAAEEKQAAGGGAPKAAAAVSPHPPPLHVAARSGCYRTVSMLLGMGEREGVEAPSSQGVTLTQGEQAALVRVAGGVHTRDGDGETALHAAVRGAARRPQGCAACAELLLRAGADPQAPAGPGGESESGSGVEDASPRATKLGRTPLQMAEVLVATARAVAQSGAGGVGCAPPPPAAVAEAGGVQGGGGEAEAGQALLVLLRSLGEGGR